MKKKLLMVLFPVILMIAGSLAVWANEQGVGRPGCNKCAQVEKMSPCANCPNAAKMGEGCANCPKAAKTEQGCANCSKMKGAEAGPAAAPCCDNCAKMQQPVQKGCCDKSNL